MKKFVVFLFVGLFLAASVSAASAEPYDRYERDRRDSPPRGAGAPPPRHSVHGEPYFFGHVGMFDPNTENNGLRGYNSGASFDVGLGSRVSPVLAIEGTLGGYTADVGSNEVSVVPLTFGVRLVLPHPFIEPYVGAGLGFYNASLDEPSSGINDTDTAFGGYFGVGMDAWLNQRIALNFEGRYHMAEPTFNGVKVDVGGWTVGMGIRISF